MEELDIDKLNCLPVPRLVSSDEDDDYYLSHPVSNGDKAKLWKKQSSEEREQAEDLIGLLSLGPLLFGSDNCLENYWIMALYDASILLKKNSEKMIATFDDKQEEIIDKMDDVIKGLRSELCDESMVKCALDLIDTIEEKVNKQPLEEKIMDIDVVIATALSYPLYEKLEKKIRMKVALKGKENFGIIYILKIYHKYLMEFCNGGESENRLRIKWLNRNSKQAEEYKNLGKKEYNERKYAEAISHYTSAITSDPFNHISYSNRAVTYINMEKYREAYCDSKRSLLIEPNWHKAYYRCAQALYHLKEFKKALQYNSMGQKKFPEVKDYQTQEKEIREEMEEMESRRLNEEKIKFAMDNNIGPRKSKQKDLSKKKPDSKELSNPPETDAIKEIIMSMDIPDLVDSDEEEKLVKRKKKKKKEKKTEAEKNEDEYMAMLREGSEAYLNNKYDTAVEKYNQATDFYRQTITLVNSVKEIDIVVRLYATGMALTERGVYSSITTALTKFRCICEEHSSVVFPPVYYGLTRCYLDHNRFSEALEPCKKGLELVSSGVQCGQLLWPGTEIVISHTDNKFLKTCLLELLEKIKFPPKPDVVCRFHDPSSEDKRTAIYFSDFYFKGFVRIECYAKCLVEFHPHCWKFYKKRHDVHSDKDILNSRCLTPDCFSFIRCISIYHNSPLPENAIIKIADSPPDIDKITKPVVRMKPSSFTIAKREAKKNLRKQRKLENKRNRIDDNANIGSDAAVASNSNHHEDVKVEQDLDDAIIIYKKDEDNDERQKGKKTFKGKKKEKKKNAAVLNVEVNFTDRKEEKLAGTFTDFDNLELPSANVLDVKRPSIDPAEDKIAQELFNRFAALLGVTGPLHVQDKILLEEIANFPPDAKAVIQKFGGIRQFLLNCLRFALIEDFVCLLKDAVKATEMAKSRYPKHRDLQMSDSCTSTSADSTSLISQVSKPQNPTVAMSQPTKLRSGIFEAVDKAETASAAVKNEFEMNIWHEMAEKRKKGKFNNPVSPIDEQTVRERIVNTDRTKASSSRYNALDDFSIKGLDNIDDITLGIKKSKMDDIDDFEKTGGPMRLLDKLQKGDDSQIPSRSSSVSDISEQSDISIDMLYGSASPSSVSSKSSLPSNYRGSPLCHMTPSSPVIGSVKNYSHMDSPSPVNGQGKNNLQKPACPTSMEGSSAVTKKDVKSKLFHNETDKISTTLNPCTGPELEKNGDGMQKKFENGDSKEMLSKDLLDKGALTSSSKQPNGRNGSHDELNVRRQSDDLLENQSSNQDSSTLSFPVSQKIGNSAIPKFEHNLSTSTLSTSEGQSENIKPQQNLFPKFLPPFQHYPSNNPISPPTNPHKMAQTEKAWKEKEADEPREKFKVQQDEAFKNYPKAGSGMYAFPNFPTLYPRNPVIPFPNRDGTCFQESLPATAIDRLPFPLNCNNSAPILEHQPTLPIPHIMRKTSDAQVQAVAMTTENGINTDLDMDKLLREYVMNFQEVEQLQLKKQYIKEKFGKEILSLSEEVKALKLDKQRLQRNLEQNLDLLSDSKKALKQVEEEKSSLHLNLGKKCLDLEAAKITSQELKNQLQLISENQKSLLARAKNAEIMSLKVQEESAEKLHAQTQNQAQFHIDHLSRLVVISPEGESKQSALAALNHWKNIYEQTDSNLSSLKVKFEHQRKLIAEGKMLSELSPISCSPPLNAMQNMPPPPPPQVTPQNNVTGSASGAIPKVPQSQATVNATGISRPPPGFRNPGVARVPRQLMPSAGATSVATAFPGRIGAMFRQAGRTESGSPVRQTSTDKLMQRLQFLLPNHTKHDFLKVISELRAARGGKLSGLSLDAIEKFVTEKLQSQNKRNTTSAVSEREAYAPDLEMFTEDEDPCAICHEELSALPIRTLKCKHNFHEVCIQQWMKEQKTCPNCRVHIVLPEEFPALC